jgi:hypothetical protein
LGGFLNLRLREEQPVLLGNLEYSKTALSTISFCEAVSNLFLGFFQLTNYPQILNLFILKLRIKDVVSIAPACIRQSQLLNKIFRSFEEKKPLL